MKKTIHALKSKLKAKVIIPGSKSMTNRALLLASLAQGVSEISDMLLSDDTRHFVNALHELGIVVQLDVNTRSCIVAGAGGRFPKDLGSIWCGDAGTAARFLLAACASSPGKYSFDGSDQLRVRPIEPLLKILNAQGAKFFPENIKNFPLTVLGVEHLSGGEIDIDASLSGQFVSALLMVAPFAKSPVILEARHLGSQSYVNMTIAMMAEFGVVVRRMHRERFTVPVPQRYVARDYVIEPDLSTASYFFAAAAVSGGEITIQPLKRQETKQGDVKFLTVLEKMGCEVVEASEGLTVKGPSSLQGINVDMRDFSDTFMTLAAIAPFAKSPTTITNIRHTRYQESNRIENMAEGLKRLGLNVETGSDWIKVYPGNPKGTLIESYYDHRLAMSFAVIGLRVSDVIINNAECVSKTCPEFFSLWEKLYSG